MSDEFITLEAGNYEVKYTKQGADVLISFTKAAFTENALEEGYLSLNTDKSPAIKLAELRTE
jgi:hypothetical protein